MKLEEIETDDLDELVLAARLCQAIYEDDTRRALLAVCQGAEVILVNGKNTDTNCAVMLMPNNPITWRVVFRGTSSVRDVMIDMQFGRAIMTTAEKRRLAVHSGFLRGLDEVSEDIMKACRELGFPRHEGRIMSTGHSLGGALSVLFNLRHINVDSVTFGAPKVFINNGIPLNGWCVEMNGDPIPHLPVEFKKCSYGKLIRLPGRLMLDHPISGYVVALEKELKRRGESHE